MYGDESKLVKDDWVKKAISKEARWAFKPDEMRQYVWALL